MIDEIIIYSDGNLASFDSDHCQIPTASGTWNLIPTIIGWMLEQYPSRLPDECRTAGAKIYFCCRNKDGEQKMRIPTTHFLKLGTNVFNLKDSIICIENENKEED